MSLMQTLESRSARDRVKAHVYDRLLGRGEPPKGWTREAMLEDYVDALGGYPEHVLAEASKRVRSTNTRPTWPMAGAFKAACEDIGSIEAPKSTESQDEVALVKRSAAAHDYVHRRMAADEFALRGRAFALGPWGKIQIEKFLLERAFVAVREGREPHVSNVDLNEFIRSIEPEARERQRGMAEVAAGAPKPSRAHQPMRRNLPPNLNTQAAVELSRVHAGPPVDLDEEIPPPASEADYGQGPEIHGS
jgi:hypothetical protein